MTNDTIIIGEPTIAKLRAGETVEVRGVALIPASDLMRCARPEVVPNGWNEAIDAATKMLRSSADNCQPGSPAETHNWPFVLETMARKVEGLKLSPRSPLAFNQQGEKK